MAVFDVTQQVVANSSGIISGNTRVNEVGLSMLEASMIQMEVGPLFGLFLQSFFIGISMPEDHRKCIPSMVTIMEISVYLEITKG